MKHFGHTLYKIIEDKHLVKKRIAEKVGITPSYFGQLMNKASFDPELLESICKVIGISPGYFFDDWPSTALSIGEINNSSVSGDATVNVGQSVEYLEKVIQEKERLIQVLLKQLDIQPSNL